MPLGKRDYAAEYREYHSNPEQKKNRAKRNAARRMMARKHGKSALRGKDVDHKDGNPHNNGNSNLRIESMSVNRGRK
jgi:hypothetical protein